MRIEREKTVVQKFVEASCDFCEGRHAMTRCRACDKDICCDHTRHWSDDPFSSNDAGDYPEKVCPECDDSVVDIRELCSRLNNEHYERIEKIETEWRASRKKALAA